MVAAAMPYKKGLAHLFIIIFNISYYRRSWYFHSKNVDSLTAWLGGKRKTGFS